MVDTRAVRTWLREDAIEELAEFKKKSDKDAFTGDVFKGGEEPCPSCGLTDKLHTYYCAVAHPQKK